MVIEPAKKTPENVTAFEREQLRFFLSDGELAAKLAEINPSLAWLSVLAEMSVIESGIQLIGWLERNFADPDGIREVVANLRFFQPETADFLESRLNVQAALLPPLLVKCWTLIIRQMRAANQGFIGSEWFEIQPQLRRGGSLARNRAAAGKCLAPEAKDRQALFLESRAAETPEAPGESFRSNVNRL